MKRSRALLASNPTRDNRVRTGECSRQALAAHAARASFSNIHLSCHALENARLHHHAVASTKNPIFPFLKHTWYDAVNRLATFDRGDLNANKDAISGTPVKEEDWGLDMTGNWTDFLQKTSGTTDLNQDRAHNPVNEITGITETTGTAWIDPVHDRAGQHDDGPQAVESGQRAHVQVGRLEPAGGSEGRRDGRGGLRIRRPRAPREVARGLAEPGQSGRSGRLRALLPQPGLAGTGIARLGQREHRARVAPAAVPVRLVAALHRRANPSRQEHRHRRPVRRRALYYLGDANFNVTTLIDTSGDALERYVYTPYGVLTIYDATWSNVRSASSYANVYTYTGRQLDAETGLFHYRHRVYAAQLGRFVSRDPSLFESDDLSLYRYVVSNPANSV